MGCKGSTLQRSGSGSDSTPSLRHQAPGGSPSADAFHYLDHRSHSSSPGHLVSINQRLKATGMYSPIGVEAEVGSEGVGRAEPSSWRLGDRLGTAQLEAMLPQLCPVFTLPSSSVSPPFLFQGHWSLGPGPTLPSIMSSAKISSPNMVTFTASGGPLGATIQPMMPMYTQNTKNQQNTLRFWRRTEWKILMAKHALGCQWAGEVSCWPTR